MKDVNLDNFVEFYQQHHEFELPPGFSDEASELVRTLLQVDLEKRPFDVKQVLKLPFFADNPLVPDSLPTYLFERGLSVDEILKLAL